MHVYLMLPKDKYQMCGPLPYVPIDIIAANN